MKNIELGHTIGILANIGVIAGIVFLAFEVNQNSESLAMGARSTLVASKIAEQTLIASNVGGLAEIWLKANRREPLTELESYQLAVSINMSLFSYEATYREVMYGLLTESDIPIGQWTAVMRMPAVRDDWESRRLNLDPAFVQFVEDRLFAPEP